MSITILTTGYSEMPEAADALMGQYVASLTLGTPKPSLYRVEHDDRSSLEFLLHPKQQDLQISNRLVQIAGKHLGLITNDKLRTRGRDPDWVFAWDNTHLLFGYDRLNEVVYTRKDVKRDSEGAVTDISLVALRDIYFDRGVHDADVGVLATPSFLVVAQLVPSSVVYLLTKSEDTSQPVVQRKMELPIAYEQREPTTTAVVKSAGNGLDSPNQVMGYVPPSDYTARTTFVETVVKSSSAMDDPRIAALVAEFDKAAETITNPKKPVLAKEHAAEDIIYFYDQIVALGTQDLHFRVDRAAQNSQN